MVRVHCAACGNEVLYYQKDGDGALKRCYLNRIFAPEAFAQLQHDRSCTEPRDLPPLVCPRCDVVIGKAIRHYDGRLAFRLRPGLFFKKRDTEKS